MHRFKVKDKISGQFIYNGESELSNFYLVLRHKQEGKSHTVTSVHQPASILFNSKGEKEVKFSFKKLIFYTY